MRALFSAKLAMDEAHVLLSRLWMEGWSFRAECAPIPGGLPVLCNTCAAKAALRAKTTGCIKLLAAAQEEVKAEIERAMPHVKRAKAKKAVKKGKGTK